MKNFYAILYIVLIALVIALVPFSTIFAINTLFSTSIAYTFWTWMSVIILNITVIDTFRTANKE